jgi:mannitol/fructose-specific phosphotransferase system IIA component (Ntr-type)
MTTGIGFGWALPHIFSDIVTARVVALGKSRRGVDFTSVDGIPAYSVLLMILPPATESD